MIEHTDYRLALILPHSRQLLGMPTSGTVGLPVMRIPLWVRAAEQLTKQIEARWKIRTIVLDILFETSSETPCAVVEIRTDSWDFENEGFCIVQPDKICGTSLADSQIRSLETILVGDETNRGPFSRIGWIKNAKRWIRSSVDKHEVLFTGEILQLNGGGAFCLLRLGTKSGPAYWIKGVGESNSHEFAITDCLAKHCPEYLPPIVAMRGDWNSWVMEEFGSSLHSSGSLADFQRAAHRLASLQKLLVGNSDELLRAQCADHRTSILDSQVDDIIEYLDEAMRLQTSIKVPPIPTSRLHEIRDTLHTACAALQEICIPDSLMHNDISPGSILSDGTDTVFTDWCEACVGNPFITFEQLCVHAARKTDEAGRWIQCLSSTYKACWGDVLAERQIDRALQIAPLVAVLSYLHGRGDWQVVSYRSTPAFLSYSRTLARQMDKVARRPELQEALCQPR